MNKKEVKKAPILRFKGFTNDWEQRKFTELGKLYYGKSAPKWSVVEKGGTPCIRYGELYTKYSSKIDNVYSHTSIDKSKLKFSTGNELLIPRVGEEPLDFAKHTSWLSIPNVAIGEMITVLKTKENPLFLANYLRAKYVFKFARLVEGGNVSNLYFERYEDTNILIPSKNEQQNISKLILKIDKLITLQQRKVKMLILLKKEISNYYFSPSYLSRSCKENSFKEIFTVVTDYVANGSFKSLRENVKTNTKQGYAYMIRLQDASNNWKGPWLYTDKSGYNFLKKSKIYPGDIVMSNVGSVGKIIRIPKLSKPMTLAPNAILLRSTKYDNDFLYELLKSDYGKNKIKRMTTPGVQNKINKTDFKKIKVHLPNSQEQKRISCLLTNMNILIHEVKSNISQKQKLKQFLLQNMFI